MRIILNTQVKNALLWFVSLFLFFCFFREGLKGGGGWGVATVEYVFSLEKSTEKSIRNKFSFFLLFLLFTLFLYPS